MKVLIVVNAYMRNKSQENQALRIKQELTELGAEVELCRNFNLACIENGVVKAKTYDFCVFLDKDKIAARMLEKSGMRLFNSAAAVEVCDDKMLTHIALAGSGADMPDCVYAPLCYDSGQCADGKFLSSVVQKLGLPLVGKRVYGSLGAGVELIKSVEELFRYENENIMQPHFYQRFIKGSAGQDLRVIVVGGKYLCTMLRKNESDFRSNIALGGVGSAYEAEQELINLCERVAKILGLDYCGIDILKDEDGKYYVCEVNSNAFFAAAERVCGVNVAKAYARHMISQMSL